MLTFNIVGANAADVTLQLEDDNSLRYISSDFKSVLNLPHPIVLKQMIDSSKNNSSENFLLLAYYFDAKYPNDAIEYDFSEDVAIIFPQLTSQEVIKRTNLIRTSVKTYRWGKDKFKQIADDMVAPKAPPLLVDDDEYALMGTVDYVPVPEGSFAVINDFKKVVSYSNDKKDVEAMEAYRLRQLEKKENKTDYEKFKSMASKLEFSKIASYGVDLPNPFIGNAGIGKWIEKDAYNVRLISEIAQISDTKSFLAGLHIKVPNHRFMLANGLSDTLQKPKIELFDTKNIKSYEVLYPLSVPIADENMIHAYSADFIFPIKIETVNSDDEVSFSAKISFSDCDSALNCETRQISSQLIIEKGIDNMSSAVKSFVRQSFYNVPSENSKHLKIDEIYADVSDDKQTVENIKIVLSFKKKPKNFSVLIENDINTRFLAPKIAINNDKVYVTVKPLSDNDVILDYPLTLTVKLNGYSHIRKIVNLEPYRITDKISDDTIDALLMAFLSGLLFYITPIGLMLLCLGLKTVSTQSGKKKSAFYFVSFMTTIVFGFAVLVFTLQHKQDIYWGRQYTDIFLLNLAALATMGIMLSVKYRQNLLSVHNKLKAMIYGFLTVLMLFYSNTLYLEQLYSRIDISTKDIYIAAFVVLGLGLPHICIALIKLRYNKSSLSKRAKLWLASIVYYTALFNFVYLAGILFLQISLYSFAKAAVMFGICFLLYKYAYNFIEAMYKTDLSKKKKQIAEHIVLVVFLSLFVMGAKISANNADFITTDNSDLAIYNEIEEKLKQNKIVIVGINADWSYISLINKLTTYNSYTLKRLEKTYNVEYVDISANIINKQIQQILQEHNSYSLPVNILYSINLNKGIVLPKMVKSTELEQIIQNFKI